MKQQKEQDTAGKDIDGEQTLKDMDSSLRSTSKAPSVDQADFDDSVKLRSRRKHPLKTEDISYTPDNKKKQDASLVGSKIKVWWPDDKEFYEGVVDSYDPDTKKHMVAYEDGEIKVLLLMDERWEHVESDSRKDVGKRKAEGNAEISQSKKVKGSSSTTSKQSKSQAQSKSGKDSGSKDVSRPRGRP
ncbi:DNA mismatch repair protein MSH6 [Asparagus officinalis]|uniref:DNA mismatch repair protein MSH6 n=1 Tax=Asparagus officinalis TaxID=4686 RepID=UPI00098E353F|nr:DNA mismatch repair protein MSH6 [Asparagus officinalis]